MVLDELRLEVEAILGTFAETCCTAGVLFSIVELEDAPARAIESEAEGCDLIVIGKDTNFHFEAEPDLTATVARLIREKARPVLVVSVAATKEAAGARLAVANKLFAAHDIPVRLHPTAADADAGEIILAEVDALEPALLVMGAFGHTGLRDLFLGSATRSLLHQCDTRMFICH